MILLICWQTVPIIPINKVVRVLCIHALTEGFAKSRRTNRMQMILTAELEMSKSTIYRVCCVITLIGFTYLASGLVAQNEGSARRHAVKHLDANQLQTRVAKMLSEFGLTAKVSKDPNSNALIIDGAPEAQRIAAQLITTIDKEPIENQSVQSLPAIEAPKQSPNEVRGYEVDPNLLQATSARLAQ
ncbi:MAG TPA: hypothetical protein DIT88_00215, partial [Planctomycetaceae bacterium]|nr:hypothetical protein [Planctomycetaceae bacterium]